MLCFVCKKLLDSDTSSDIEWLYQNFIHELIYLKSVNQNAVNAVNAVAREEFHALCRRHCYSTSEMLRLESWVYQATAIPLDSDAITSHDWFLYINHMKSHMYPKFL